MGLKTKKRTKKRARRRMNLLTSKTFSTIKMRSECRCSKADAEKLPSGPGTQVVSDCSDSLHKLLKKNHKKRRLRRNCHPDQLSVSQSKISSRALLT